MERVKSGIRRLARPSVISMLVALLVLGMGVINVVSALIGISIDRLRLLHPYLPLEVTHGTRTLTVLAGMLLILLSWSIFRRKQRGWLAAMLLLGTSSVLHLLKGLDYEEAISALCVMTVLFAARREFVVRSDSRAMRGAVVFSLIAVAGWLLYGIFGLYLLRHQFTPDFTWSRAVSTTVSVLVPTGKPALTPLPVPAIHHLQHAHRLPHLRDLRHIHPLRRDAFWFLNSLVAAAFASALYIAGALIRPVAASLHALDHEREEAFRLLTARGGTPLAYWTLMPGLTYLFSHDRTAFLAYRVVEDTAVVLGEPQGDATAFPALIGEFARLCHHNDWRPCWYQVTDANLPAFTEQGWRTVKIGEEALIDLPELAFTGKKWQSVRTAMNRVPQEGYAAVWYDVVNDPRGWLPQLAQISRDWLVSQHGEEKGFSMGTWELAQRFGREQRFLVLHDAENHPVAYLSFVPIFGEAGGWALDLMRRQAETPQGAMEFLLATALATFHDEGAKVASLGLSPFASITPADSTGTPELLERARQLIYQHFNSFFSFKGLNHFKKKFQPRWEPRYLVYPSLASMPLVSLALIRVHSGRKKPLATPPMDA